MGHGKILLTLHREQILIQCYPDPAWPFRTLRLESDANYCFFVAAGLFNHDFRNLQNSLSIQV